MTSNTFKTLLLTTAALVALSACSDGTSELGSPGSTGTNPGVGAGGGSNPGTGGGGASTGPCPTGTTTVTVGTQSHCRLPAAITSDLRLTAGPLYQMNSAVLVGQDQGPVSAAPIAGRASATLTIDPGVTVYGATPTARLVVARGSKLVADGALNAPITFTSANDLGFGSAVGYPSPRDPLPATAKTDPYRGEWGGLIINGRAPINTGPAPASSTVCAASTVSQAEGEGDSGCYGGDNPNDNSGVLRYVRVKYAGVQFTPTNELNAFAFEGVGRGTVLDFLQAHNGSDDAFEWFGGTVDAKHLVATGPNDDGFDWTYGWNGRVQYGLIVQNPLVARNTDEFGIEADNNDINLDATPRASPTMANLTIVGVPGATDFPDTGIRLRRGTAGKLFNIVVGPGWLNGGLILVDAPTLAQFNANMLQLKSWFITQAAGATNAVRSSNTSFTLTDFRDGTRGGSPNNTVNTGTLQPAVAGGNVYINGPQETAVVATDPRAATGDSFFDATNYVGAVQNTGANWTAGWTVWLNN